MMRFLENYILPYAAKFGNQRHLLAIRDTLVGMIAITMVGSLFVLLNNIGEIIKPYGKMMEAIFGKNWQTLGGDIWWGTMAFMTIFAVFGIAYKLAKSYGDEGFEAMLIAGASYFVLIPQTTKVEGVKEAVWGIIDSNYFGSVALFTGIIVSIIATEIFIRLSRIKKLEIKLPDGVPPAVARSFQRLIPGMATIFIIGVIGLLFRTVTHGEYFNDWLSRILVEPLSGAVDSLPFAILVTLLIHLFWSIGLHGDNILEGIKSPLLTKLGTDNINLYKDHVTDLSQYHVFAGSFSDAYVNLGGSGATLGLLIALIIAARKRHKQMVAIASPPGLFQINEPVIFGMPIVLNPIWLIPFILTPVVLTIIAYLAVSLHLVFPVVANIPWVTPVIVNGWLATGGHISGAVLSGVNLIVSVLIWLPFVAIQGKMDAKRIKEATQKVESSPLSMD
ncbi:PTS sugar transporter subunit IIC [Bacillus sp. FJAT-49736]|uniref:PTS sugar transporter subunit IIC n=1 Tax=Bacillus sp. FJAT-49736 TaxID=2833582 RepID=UPI001BC963DA|nr:PTS sugar transporter subunit IIC [Bacillus sp. FJAT-49736]MBS4174565.1 PTS sugar transporter subunit IIC [Bacillus sp. FJAT-49736]